MTASSPITEPSNPDKPLLLLGGRPVRLELSRSARAALSRQRKPVTIEMELYFSCLIRKRVNILAAPRDDVARIELAPNITLSFRAVSTGVCVVDGKRQAELQAMPVVRGPALVPHWLRLDYRGEWSGEFGY